ncbi:unnamed protein product, partial [Brachionus calyciflorus]
DNTPYNFQHDQQQQQQQLNYQDFSQNDTSSQQINDYSQNSQDSQTSQLEPEQFRKVFIGGLSFKTDDETFKAYFSKFGELLDYVVMKDKETGKSRGFGFVTYATSSQVDELMKNRPHMIDGRQVETKRATPREDSGKHEVQATVKKLFVGGIRDNISEDDIRNYFGAYGNITDCVIMKDKETNKTRGFGFVSFDDYDPVDKIILEKHHSINGIALQCQKAVPKDGQGQGGPGGRGQGRGQGGFNQPQQSSFGSFNPSFSNAPPSGGFQMGGNFPPFGGNGSMQSTYGSYNQAPPQSSPGPRRGGGVAGGSGIGPMRGGQGRFTGRSQGPYGGGMQGQGGSQGFNRGGGQRGGGQRGGRGIGQRGGGGGRGRGHSGPGQQQQFYNQ